jgi:hypothetical protein
MAGHVSVRWRASWLVFTLGALGCGTNQAVGYYYDSGKGGSGGSGGSSGTSSDAGSCPGRCVDVVPLSTPVVLSLLWIGPVEQEPPTCPVLAPVAVDEGFADLTATQPVCQVCACEPPKGSCDLPLAMTASNQPCGKAPDMLTVFNPPAEWDGSCSTANAIPANLSCSGVPCVKSLTIAPLTLHQWGCGVSNPPPADIAPPTWGKAARACVGSAQYRGGCDLSQVCAPVPSEESAGFKLCFAREGEQECPGAWSEKHVFYKGIDDSRACSECSCGAPVGSKCSAQVSAYDSPGCIPSGTYATVPMTNTQSGCVDTTPGMGLLSKSATPPVYAPGVCQPLGGEPSGEAFPANPTTFCCVP